MGGGSNNKKDHAAGKTPRCPLSFLFFFVFLQNTFKIDVFVLNLVKNVSSKKNKKDHDFCLFWSFLFFLPDFVDKMSSNREQKRTNYKKIMPPGKSQNVLCLFCCWTPPSPIGYNLLRISSLCPDNHCVQLLTALCQTCHIVQLST